MRALQLEVPVPDHTTLSRRGKKLGKIKFGATPMSGPIHLLVDSTGVSVHSGNRRRPPKNRSWRELHIAVDRISGEVVAVELTAKRARDGGQVPRLLRQVERGLVSVAADGAYHTEAV